LALSNLYELYYAVAWNNRLAAVQDARANVFAERAEAAFRRDQALSDRYHQIAGGKWDGMMLQIHIGYSLWHEPEKNLMPPVTRVAGKAKSVVFAKPTLPVADIVIEAPRFTRAIGGKGLTWQVIPHLGRTLGAVMTLPQGAASTSEADGVRLDYNVTLKQAGDVTGQFYMVPAIDTDASGGLRLGVSLDDGPMQALTYNLIPTPGDAKTADQALWIEAMQNNVHVVTAHFPGAAAGKHTLKVWRLTDNIVLQKIVLDTGPIPPSYLGPAETKK
jgi:hypothetical protein